MSSAMMLRTLGRQVHRMRATLAARRARHHRDLVVQLAHSWLPSACQPCRGIPAADGLGLQVLLKALDAALAADAAALVAAERRVGAVEHAAVDAERAGPDAPGDRHAAFGRPRHHRAGQAEGAVVGDPHRLVVVVERQHHQHRAEDLLLRDRRAVVDADDHRRRHEVPAGQVRRAGSSTAPPPTVISAPSRRARSIAVSTRSFCAALITGPTKGLRQRRIPDRHHAERRGDVGDRLVEQRPVHQHPGGRRAGLPGVHADADRARR